MFYVEKGHFLSLSWTVSVIQPLMMDDNIKEELQSVKGKLEKEMEKTNQISLKLFINGTGIAARLLLKIA